jgi:hypothetical protein
MVVFWDKKSFYENLCQKTIKRLFTVTPDWNVWNTSIVCVVLVLLKNPSNIPMPDGGGF